MSNDNKDQLHEFLYRRVSSYVTLLENILGQRDRNFQLKGVHCKDSYDRDP